MNNAFIKLSKSSNTVFSFNDLAYYFGVDKQKLVSKVTYYTKKWYLYKIKRGLYSINKNYNVLELAIKIQKWSYISLETALKKYGINFQYQSEIYVIWYKNEEIIVDSNKIIFKVIKKDVRENFEWIISEDNYMIASKYRAILDTLYLYKEFFFDNLDDIDWWELEKLSKIYNSKILEKRVTNLKDNYLKNEYYS
jgi:predicted transcriptional regulator of viral defense system